MKLVSLVIDDEFVRLKDNNDNTIVHILSANKRTQVIKFLLDNTNIAPEINALNVDMLTALDELYLVQWEAGFSELEQILVGKGAKRSSDLSLGLPTNFSLKLNKQDSKWLKRMEPSFLVLAVLVVTVTYAAVLNPPGGFWSDDYPDPGSKQNHTAVLNHPGGYPDPASKQNHTAGESILWTKDRLRYHTFYAYNSVGFFSSLAIIRIIVTKHEVYPTIMLQVLTSSTLIVMLSLTLAYIFPLWLGGASWWVCLVLIITSSPFYLPILCGPGINYLRSKILGRQR
ncbi:hypothetical protein MRB53_025038 [Persea americana]|uniref:Uncharacterized protein n=1 Tax=Persea americana TaxID=3435 RepID=A0ACC2LEM7_PERAE|nr:hypothetical protein MRB53_025038 [Persea americana]